jgi:hypothetical protein
VLSGESQVSADDLIVRDCKGDAETGPDGTVYYSNGTEIRRLLPGETGSAAPTQATGAP